MSNKGWKPDDSFHDLVDGEFKGVIRVREALEEAGFEFKGKDVVTSRDEGMQKLRDLLKREHMPDGFQQWQLPIILGSKDRPVMPFITVGEPKAVVPKHVHRNDCLLRIVLSGSLVHDSRVEMTTGDWIYMPAGVPYTFTVGDYGCVMMHLYNGSGLYWHQDAHTRASM
ncbi:hypothetical protein Poly51_61980 [Rubripirellula tenax]|uniref:Cupin domain protein n=1 Tax=Rubripirellula tenax TaxID=2528015 RepID=A0A5C6E885_9BACT|nr:cupin domain-containing protein [Rubripirellula tenax]TWU43676.1 hypothetical protein Poly51_61980 [Rubripirellula tenax]